MTEREPWSELITVRLVLDFRDEGIKRYGGLLATKPAEDCIEGSLGAAWSAGLYREPEEAKRGLCFTAHALYYIAKNHCFTEGNKRAAWMSAIEILARLGLTVNTTIEEAFGMMEGIIKGHISGPDEVTHWLAERLDLLTIQ
jgi:death-on-curing protein